MIRSAAFLEAYSLFPHRAINRASRVVARLPAPAPVLRAAIDVWSRRAEIDLADFEPGPFESLEHFFLRRLAPGARPLGPGLVAAVDGFVVGEGAIDAGTILQVKGHPISVDQLVNGPPAPHRAAPTSLAAFEGGRYLTTFLRPSGYHYVHAPEGARVERVRWIPGRFFPQNEDALREIPRIYLRNERAVLELTLADGTPLLLVMVGASVVGGIHVRGVDDEVLRRARVPAPIGRDVTKGEELGHFTFGSTVVLLAPRGFVERFAVTEGQRIDMGRALTVPPS